ncbi:MAG: hypothetical protein HY303_12745 [Candidatus Wallbacteria bacterium]|nr:hypothetical protein [Candidatus Wallbacteria bacterium]
MKPTAAQDLDLVGAGGNLHVSWTTRQPDGRYRLYAACARGPAQSFSEPILLGGATDCGDASSLSAGSLGGGSDLVLVTWEATPAGASSKRTALLAAWMSDDGHLLAAPAALWEERNAPNRGAWSDLRAMVSQRKAVLYFEDVFRKDDNTKALFMARSNGPDEVWSPARQVSLPTDDPDAEFPSPARAGGLRLLQWTQTGASAVMGRNIMVGPLDAAGTTVSSARVLSPGAGNHACHNSLAALGSRAWSAWEERLLKSTNWATSESAGTSWTRPERLCSYSSGWRPPALAVTNRGECWVVWAGDAGGVQAMRLP